MEELVNHIINWVDYTYEEGNWPSNHNVPPKRGPMYDVSELHSIPLMEDELYDLIAPRLTVSLNTSVNVNTIGKPVIKALFPEITEEEKLDELINTRDDQEKDGKFKKPDDFLEAIKSIGGNFTDIEKFKTELQKKNIEFVVAENTFNIEVSTEVNTAKLNLEASVQIIPPQGASAAVTCKADATQAGCPAICATDPNDSQCQAPPPSQGAGGSAGTAPTTPKPRESGLRITKFRIL